MEIRQGAPGKVGSIKVNMEVKRPVGARKYELVSEFTLEVEGKGYQLCLLVYLLLFNQTGENTVRCQKYWRFSA